MKKLLLVVAALVSQPAFSQGVTSDRILLGQSVALTGPAAELGIQMRNGAKTYFDHINAQGGVHGRKIELITLDDGYEPTRTVPNTKKLIEENKVFALFGYVGTPTSTAALPLFTQAKVPFFGAFTGAEVFRQPFNRYIFNVRASYYDETDKIVEQVVSTGGKNIAVFYQNDGYGQAGLKGVEIAMTKRNMKITATGAFERNTVNVGDAVKGISATTPDAVVMIGAYKACAEFIKQMKKSGSASTFYNVSFVGAKALADELGKEGSGVAISQVMPNINNKTLKLVKEFHEDFAKYAKAKDIKTAPTFFNLEGYVSARLIVEAVRRSKDASPAGVRKGLEMMKEYDLGGYTVDFSPSKHWGSQFVELSLIGASGRLAY